MLNQRISLNNSESVARHKASADLLIHLSCKSCHHQEMDSSIVIASKFEMKTLPDLLEQICAFVMEEIKFDTIPPLPTINFWMENGSHFVGIPLRITGQDPIKQILIITSDPVERPINTSWIPFSKIQSIQIDQAETISHLLTAKVQDSQPAAASSLSMTTIRHEIEHKWKILAAKNNLHPFLYFSLDEFGKSEFEKKNIAIFGAALLKAIEALTATESKLVAFNRLKTLQISMGSSKEIQYDKQGAFLIVQVNFARAPSPNLERDIVLLFNDIFAS